MLYQSVAVLDLRLRNSLGGGHGSQFRMEGNMCEKKKPDVKKFLTNLSDPMPLKKKIYLFIKNNADKIRRGKNCCGHAGQPGC
jgi:hypothetical protein